MKVKYEVTIDAPREAVWAAFDNVDNMTRWQTGLKSFTPVSGTPGQVGAVSELVYEENGREIVMQETLSERREPDLLAGMYDAGFGSTIIVNHFDALDENTTRWTSWCNYRFRGLMRFLSLFMAGAIKKRVDGDMQRFKLMVESDLADKA